MKTIYERVKKMSEYEKQADNFLKDNPKIEIKAEYLGHMPHFDGDDEQRAVFYITVKRNEGRPMNGDKSFGFRFGDSLQNSYFYREDGRLKGKNGLPPVHQYKEAMRKGGGRIGRYTIEKMHKTPSNYSILACLASDSYDPGTFDDFCASFGYDTDSKNAERTYFAVQKQYDLISRIFTADELEALREIQ